MILRAFVEKDQAEYQKLEMPRQLGEWPEFWRVLGSPPWQLQ